MIVEARSGIHIGYTKLGFIQRTRYYLHGKSMWGAVAEALTRALYNAPDYCQYIAVGKFVEGHLKFSYFFPTFKRHEDAFIPNLSTLKYGIGALQLGQNEFETTFVSSPASTSIKPESSSAEEASLHAMEYLNPVVRHDNRIRKVYFAGYLFALEGTSESLCLQCTADDILISCGAKSVSLRDVLSDFQIGGERGYGKGRLKLPQGGLVKIPCDCKLWGQYAVKYSNDGLSLEIEKNMPIFAHLLARGLEGCDIHGELEPMTGRVYKEGAGSGRKIVCDGVFYIPGSVVKDALCVHIGKYGTLTSNRGSET
jgi:hypothetical protein